ncbi:MAG: hypothetical protein ACM31C_26975 [Acidobacteriota bacterium]
MRRTITLATILVTVAALAACNGKKSEGLPPAQEWSADQAGALPPSAPTGSPHSQNPHAATMGGDPNDPHAGVDMGGAMGDPSDPNNPHAGVDMTNPHGAGGVDVAKMGLPAPDPNRALDPTHHIKGTILIHPKAKDRVKEGTAVFLVAKHAGPDGQPSGPPLAVEKLTWTKDALPFEITEANAMIGGTELTGDVVITAHYDQDGDALSKQPGDVTGQLRVKVPADDVKLYLDNVL